MSAMICVGLWYMIRNEFRGRVDDVYQAMAEADRENRLAASKTLTEEIS